MSVETVDCPHCAEAGEVSPTCSCLGSGTIDTDALSPHPIAPDDDDDDDGWAAELAEINAERDYFADDEAV